MRSGFRHPAPHHQCARIRGQPCVERLDFALEYLAGEGVDGDLDRRALLELAHVALGHREVHPDRIERLEPDQRLPRGHILSLLDPAETEPAGKRGDDIFLGDDGLHLRHRRGRGIALGNRRVEHRLRDRAGLHQLGLALEIEIGLQQRRLVVGEVRFLDRGVELNELSALLHVVAALEEICDHLAAQLRGHVHALDGKQRADRMHPVGPALGLRRFRRHGRRRRHHLADELGNHLRLEHEVEIADPAEEYGDDDGGNDEALDHGVLRCCCPEARDSHASRGLLL